jgi:PIN domain nuclease of toxin-antitoxin system
MRLLLDTHALLWFWEGDTRLSEDARAALLDANNARFVSYATAWEIAIKVSLGKLFLAISFEELFPAMVLASGFQPLPIKFEHLGRILSLPWHHRDPFDRVLIAQADREQLIVVSGDPQFLTYGVSVLW